MQIQIQEDQSLVRALEIFASEDAEVASRARRALDVLLEGVYQSCWPEVAWRFSKLTADGFPVRFTFMPNSQAIMYACEVAGPETQETERFDRALERIVKLGAGQLAEEQVLRLREIQAGRNLLYGACVSGRHDRQGDRYKVYIETPGEGGLAVDRLVGDLLGREWPLHQTRKIHLRMVGCEIPKGRTELYFQVDGLEAWEVGRLMSYAGLEQRKPELLELIHAVSGKRVEPQLRACRLGFSYSFSPSGGPTVFSLYTFAKLIFGPDGWVRERLLRAAKRLGWDLHHYALYSEPLSGRTEPSTSHGMIGFVVTPERPLSIHIGLSASVGPNERG